MQAEKVFGCPLNVLVSALKDGIMTRRDDKEVDVKQVVLEYYLGEYVLVAIDEDVVVETKKYCIDWVTLEKPEEDTFDELHDEFQILSKKLMYAINKADREYMKKNEEVDKDGNVDENLEKYF